MLVPTINSSALRFRYDFKSSFSSFITNSFSLFIFIKISLSCLGVPSVVPHINCMFPFKDYQANIISSKYMSVTHILDSMLQLPSHSTKSFYLPMEHNKIPSNHLVLSSSLPFNLQVFRINHKHMQNISLSLKIITICSPSHSLLLLHSLKQTQLFLMNPSFLLNLRHNISQKPSASLNLQVSMLQIT